MPLTATQLSREQILRIREQYAAGVVVQQIESDNDVSKYAVYVCVAGGPLMSDGKREFDAIPFRRPASRQRWGANGKARRKLRATLIGSLWLSAEAQLREIEARRDLDGVKSTERARDARIIAVVAKTLRDLGELDPPVPKKNTVKRVKADSAQSEVNYDDPRQIDDFRRELARRIAALAGGASPEAAG